MKIMTTGVALVLMLGLSGCYHYGPGRVLGGAAVGAAAGAVGGAIVGAPGVGAAAGAAAGAIIGGASRPYGYYGYGPRYGYYAPRPRYRGYRHWRRRCYRCW